MSTIRYKRKALLGIFMSLILAISLISASAVQAFASPRAVASSVDVTIQQDNGDGTTTVIIKEAVNFSDITVTTGNTGLAFWDNPNSAWYYAAATQTASINDIIGNLDNSDQYWGSTVGSTLQFFVSDGGGGIYTKIDPLSYADVNTQSLWAGVNTIQGDDTEVLDTSLDASYFRSVLALDSTSEALAYDDHDEPLPASYYIDGYTPDPNVTYPLRFLQGAPIGSAPDDGTSDVWGRRLPTDILGLVVTLPYGG